MQRRFLSLFTACAILLAAGQAAADTFAVAPFKVNGPDGYAYLGKAVPPMVSSRLFRSGKMEPSAAAEALQNQKAPAGKADAQRIMKSAKADWLVYGSVTVLGNNASVDMSILDAKGNVWQGSAQGTSANLLTAIQSVSDKANAELFGQKSVGGNAAAPMNSDFVVNERSRSSSTYMNPALRYQGSDAERTRSQSLDYASRGMELADVDLDGVQEVLLLSDDYMYVYRWSAGKLQELDSYRFASNVDPLCVSAIKQGGAVYIAVPAWDNTSKTASSLLLQFRGGKFAVLQENLPYFINVISKGPNMVPTLVGQDPDGIRAVRGPVYECAVQGGKVQRLNKMSGLPKEANVFNFTWIPGNRKGGGDLTAVISASDETLLTNSSTGSRLAKTEDKYAGTGVGIPVSRDFPGMGTSADDSGMYYYVPSRLISADLDRDGNYELILIHPVSTGASLLQNYRTFPQGEVEALSWDGVGMDILWKTRRIKGTVTSLGIGDPDNNGVTDLVVNINTYPGTFGVGKVRTLLSLYPLDQSAADPSSGRIFVNE